LILFIHYLLDHAYMMHAYMHIIVNLL